MISHSQRADYFERKYLHNGRTLHHRSNYFDREKYERTLSILPRPFYPDALEIGCAIGAMTEHLSIWCGQVTAIDCAENALSLARERCQGLGNIRFKKATVPDEFPAGRYDLITMCEMGYYLSLDDLLATCALMVTTLKSGGHILLAHRFGEIGDGPLDAKTVHDYVRRYSGLRSVVSVARTDYLVDVLQGSD